ncbi:TetR/AcrR family transcriptional regulator C-terminal domain-containing protein [Pseudomonas sp. NFX15]|uniref:TetR/AcrR family transcriptional regulator C-terminal domain-containing protein n=1 Tax=Pseudomonas sp. NFX15 TaxID=2816958 RepID=UPI003B8B2D31
MFVSEGYANVSLRHLGSRVGMQAGSLYNHIENKQTLLFDLIHEHLEGLVQTVVYRISKSTSPQDKLSIFVRNHLEFQIREQASAKLMGLESRSLDDVHKVEIKTLLSRYRGLLYDIIATGIRSGSFPNQHVRSSTDAVLGMLYSVAFWFHEGHPQSLKQLTQQITVMVHGALCATIRSR